MSLQGILDGALPSLDVKAEQATASKKRGTGPRKRWTMAAIARRIGVSKGHICTVLRDDETFRALLRWDEAHRHRDHLTDEEIDEAGRYLFSRPYWQWSRHGHTECVECHRSDSPHVGRGVCARCSRARRKGWVPVPYPDAWDRTRGHEACLVCLSDERPHYQGGLCEPCWQWDRRQGWRSLPATTRSAKAAKRRKFLRKTGRLQGRRKKT